MQAQQATRLHANGYNYDAIAELLQVKRSDVRRAVRHASKARKAKASRNEKRWK